MNSLDLLNIYKDKKVLITGHTGFKGSWLSLWLYKLGAEIIGISLPPKNEKDIFNLTKIKEKVKHYEQDIRNFDQLKLIIDKEKPEIIFHLAAQPLVLDGYENPIYTYEVNALGTAHILEIMRLSSFIKTGIFITTDKVYKNNEWEWPYRENEMLGGYDPYSASKAVAELIITSYRNSFFNNADFSKHNTAIASVRAGNVIGGGDWSNNRIIPDCIRSIESNQTIELRNPNAVRPWQHVIEPIFGYLLLGAKMQQSRLEYNEAYNFGPESANIVSVKKLVEKLIEIKKTGTWKDVSNNAALHEANYLSLDINKAKKYINWFPLLTFDETIELTMEWYENYSTKNVFDLSINQIEKYCTLWTLKNGK